MVMAPARTPLISTSPIRGSAPGGPIAAAGYVSTRRECPYRRHENRESGATKNRPMRAWSLSWRGCRRSNTTASARTPPRPLGSRSQRSIRRSPNSVAGLMPEDASLPHWNVEPWPDVVAGDKLLNDLVAVFTRYVILPKHAAEASVLWVVHTWAFDA